MGNAAKIGIAVLGVAVLVVLFLVVRPGGGDDEADVTPAAQETEATTDETETETGAGETEAETNGGETEAAAGEEDEDDGGGSPDVVRTRVVIGPDGPDGVTRIDATEGQRVVLTVRSQVADHVHVHGYDLFADVAPGQPARISFRADLPGRFEIELEDRHQQIAELRVRP